MNGSGRIVDEEFLRLHSAMGGLANRRLPVYGVVKGDEMIAKVTSNRQITFPAQALDALGINPCDHLAVEECADGVILRPRRVVRERLVPLCDKLRPGYAPFDIQAFREQVHDSSLRD